MTLPLTLWTKDAFWNEAQAEQMQAWLFFGALSALLVYHLFLLFSLKEASYLFFVILLASILLEELVYGVIWRLCFPKPVCNKITITRLLTFIICCVYFIVL